MSRVAHVPTTIVTGALGVGKTTAILDLFQHRPADERWAVLVNELGEVGIDGALLQSGSGYAVREIPGGCICCTAGLSLQLHLTRLLEEERPDRLLIEPTGLATLASLVDMLRKPWFAEAIDLRATITLVDARRFLRPDDAQPDASLSQVEAADVLVLNQADRATDEERAAFEAKARSLWPPKRVVAQTTMGRLDPAWLDLEAPTEPVRRTHDLDHDHDHDHGPDAATAGWIFAPEVVFSWQRLVETLGALCLPGEALPAGALRLKGIFHTDRAWVLAQGDGERLGFQPVQHRRDSRVDWIAPRTPPPRWDLVEAALRAAIVG